MIIEPYMQEDDYFDEFDFSSTTNDKNQSINKNKKNCKIADLLSA